MPSPALLLTLATLLPLLSFTVLVFTGRRLGRPWAGLVATGAIGLSFVCSGVAMILWLPEGGGAGERPIDIPFGWIPTALSGDNKYLQMGVYVDSLTVAMFMMITLVAFLVHVFSLGYMAEDKRFARFFTYLSLFCFSMLGLVLGGTILQLFVFWELVGLCSYLLIGFWYEKKSASNAAIKAFVVNRIGDFGFLIGFGILFYHLGNVSLPSLYAALNGAGSVGPGGLALPGGAGVFTAGLLTVVGVGLFCGAMGKSAQFPLHVWLPDAMEGPTPVSALIHAATMVAAGVYLVARIFPILTPDAKLVIAIIGCVTLTMAALIAIAQSDIKKVLAYSTLSQLGYMILAIGIGSWMGGLFHLITHAFFKALLFLGSGSVIHAAHHEQEMPQYGGLIRKIPVTGITFAIAVLAIAGTPFFSGYYSKDTIITDAGAFATLATSHGGSSWYWLLFILPTVMAYVTAFYMTRCFTLTFLGKPRNQHLYDHAHESPVMWVPLLILAVLSIFGGKIGVQTLLRNSIQETNNYVSKLPGGEGFNGFGTAWQWEKGLPGEIGAQPTGGHTAAAAGTPMTPHDAHEEGHHLVNYVWWAFILGIGLGVLMYLPGYKFAAALTAIPPIRWVHTWLYRRMYFDELYFSVFVAITMFLSRLSAWFDRYVVDGVVNLAATLVRQLAVLAGMHDKYVVDGAVNGAGSLAHGIGSAVRAPQSGRIRLYVTVLMIAVALALAGAIIVVLS
jgi:proton-translocating NADH-quinone oxidoreductase chain L